MNEPYSSPFVSQKIIALYSELLSLTHSPKSENEVIRFLVDRLQELLPGYRVSLSRVAEDSIVRVIYSRGPDISTAIDGAQFDLSDAPELMNSLLALRPFQTSDIRKEPLLAPVLENMLAFSPALSRMDVPFERHQGQVVMLTVSCREAGSWHRSVADLVAEVGALLGLIFRDLRTQQQLRQSEQLFRQFAENVQVVFWMTDPRKHEMVYVSPAYESIWGRTAESLYSTPLSFLSAIHSEDRERVRMGLSRQGEEPTEQEYRVVHPGGDVRWVKDRSFPVRNELGEVIRVVGIAEDITPLRKAQERLISTQRQAASNAKFAALGEMASGIAHEINNPLAVIHGLAVQMQELLRSAQTEPVKDSVLESFESIEKMANRIAGIVKGLRTFSRQSDGDPLVLADLGLILRDTIVMCEARCRKEGVMLSVEGAAPGLPILCRSAELSQVILNLVNNALDAAVSYSDKRVSVTAWRASSGATCLAVEDSGPGIRPELRERIFQPFFTTKDVGKGTGLGLSISKGIVEAHGGRLFVDERSPKTRFVVELPSK